MTSRRRNNFSASTKEQAYSRSGGVCECHRLPNWPHPICGLKLGEGNTFYEHVDPDFFSKRNDLDNAACLTKTCWMLRTTQNLRAIAKSNRVRRRSQGIKADLRSRPIVGTIASGWRQLFGGGWERR